MHPRWPIDEEHRQRLLARATKALERRQKAGRNKTEVTQSARWWALWMTALGVIQGGPPVQARRCPTGGGQA